MSELSERVYIMEYKQRKKEKEQAERQKEIEKLQRKKEQEAERKQYEKDMLIACKKDLQNRFEEDFKLQGVKAKYYFYNIDNRENIIKSIAETEVQGNYLESNYIKFLNEIIKKYELQEEYNAEQLKELALEQAEKENHISKEQEKKEQNKKELLAVLKILWLIIKWILIILFGGIILLMKFLFGLAGI